MRSPHPIGEPTTTAHSTNVATIRGELGINNVSVTYNPVGYETISAKEKNVKQQSPPGVTHCNMGIAFRQRKLCAPRNLENNHRTLAWTMARDKKAGHAMPAKDKFRPQLWKSASMRNTADVVNDWAPLNRKRKTEMRRPKCYAHCHFAHSIR